VLNGSFEGASTYGYDILAPEWIKCTANSSPNTPDILPGAWYIWEPASKGYYYQNLSVDESGKKEQIVGTISPPIVPGNCYKISVDARVSWGMVISNWDETRDYTNPARLNVNLGTTSCNTTQSLMVIDTLKTGEGWRTFSTVFSPTDTLGKIRLQSDFINDTTPYYGHVFVDNVRVSQSGDTVETITHVVEPGQSINISMPYDEFSTFEWIGNDLECDTCSSNTIMVNQHGTYYGIKRDTSGCYYEIYKFKIYCHCTDFDTKIYTYYPNPADIFINAGVRCHPENSILQITNTLGQIIDEEVLLSDINLFTFNVQQYRPGLYFINLIVDDEIIDSVKWIKSQ